MFEYEIDNEIKQEFLSSKLLSTRKSYEYALKKIDKYEMLIGKPVYEMDYRELQQMLLMQFSNTSIGLVNRDNSIIKTYIDYCIEKNIVTHGENRAAVIIAGGAEKYVDIRAVEKRYVSRERLREYQSVCHNYQDRLILELPYIGVKGKGLQEIINLQMSDLDEKSKMLTLRLDNGKHRIISVTSGTMALIRMAYEEKTYTENNGMMTNSQVRPTPRELLINEYGKYVFRTPGNNVIGKITSNLLNSRVGRMKKWFDDPHLSFTVLRNSGMIQIAYDIYEQNGKVTKDDYMNICDRFDYGLNSPDGGYWHIVKSMFEQRQQIEGS